MANWLESMQQTYEYYIVDPDSWDDKQRITNITSCTIERDSEAETLGSASIEMTDLVGEEYVRVYLVTIQNGVRERHPLGTFLIQTPSSNFDGKIREVTVDAYTPLMELKEKLPPLGYTIREGEEVMKNAYILTDKYVRAPVLALTGDVNEVDRKLKNHFVANVDDTWLRYIKDLIANANHSFALDEMSRIMFAPDQELDAMQPIWTYTDDNSSILLPSLSMTHDLYGIPNVIEVTYSGDEGSLFARYENNDSDSPTSIVNRGREIIYRTSYPAELGVPDEVSLLNDYAERLLKRMSSVEYSITYTHGYCPVRLGDCVRLNYTRAGLTDVKAKVISQSIDCIPGCTVTETAVFTKKLWR